MDFKIIIYGLYLIIMFSFLIKFSVTDIKTMKLEFKNHFLFIPISLCSLIPNYIIHYNQFSFISLGKLILTSLLGALFGFGILFLVLLINPKSMGGADVWLMTLLGFIYGAEETLLVILFSEIVFVLIGGIIILFKKSKKNLPFIPFMTTGCLIVSLLKIIILI